MIRRVAWALWTPIEYAIFPWFLIACLAREAWRLLDGPAGAT